MWLNTGYIQYIYVTFFFYIFNEHSNDTRYLHGVHDGAARDCHEILALLRGVESGCLCGHRKVRDSFFFFLLLSVKCA